MMTWDVLTYAVAVGEAHLKMLLMKGAFVRLNSMELLNDIGGGLGLGGGGDGAGAGGGAGGGGPGGGLGGCSDKSTEPESVENELLCWKRVRRRLSVADATMHTLAEDPAKLPSPLSTTTMSPPSPSPTTVCPATSEAGGAAAAMMTSREFPKARPEGVPLKLPPRKSAWTTDFWSSPRSQNVVVFGESTLQKFSARSGLSESCAGRAGARAPEESMTRTAMYG